MATTLVTARGKEREKTTRSVFNGSSVKPFLFSPSFVCVCFLSCHKHTHTLSLSLSLVPACLLSSALQCGFFFGTTFFQIGEILVFLFAKFPKKIDRVDAKLQQVAKKYKRMLESFLLSYFFNAESE
jgi:hypothetical protein